MTKSPLPNVTRSLHPDFAAISALAKRCILLIGLLFTCIVQAETITIGTHNKNSDPLSIVSEAVLRAAYGE